MRPQDFQDYGPMRRRGRDAVRQQMATPYSGPTLELPAVVRRGGSTPSAPRPTRRRGLVLWVMLLLLGAVGGGTYAGLRYLEQRYAGRVYPNIALQGVNLTEKTPAEATALLQSQYAAFLANPVTFEYGGRSWNPTPAEIGVELAIEEDVANAMRIGRDNGVFNNLEQIWTIYQQGLDLPLTMRIDATRLQNYVRAITLDVDQPPIEAELGIDPATGSMRVIESRSGRLVLLSTTVDDVVRNLTKLQPYTAPIQTQALQPQLTSGQVAEARRTIEAMTQAPLELVFASQAKKFPLAQIDIANMIVLARVDSPTGPVLNAQLDQTALRKWVTQLADQIGRDSVEPRVEWNGGNLKITQAGRSAFRLDIERAMTLINESVVSASRTLDLPVDEVQPRATPETLAQLGITELVSVGRSDYSGSAAYRITNIKAGVRLMNGILIPPDGEFSFNENVGAIDAAHGFTEGYAIVGNRTQKEPGGGICQVSTTLFRAAFYAGVPFSDWTPHRFRISWYEKYDTIGMDSTIFTGGGPDLRFINDTGNWLLIQASVDDAKAMVTFALYGTKVPGRVVQRTQPVITNQTPAPTQPIYIDDREQPVGSFYQSDTARGGLDIRIDRIILQDGKVVNRRSFVTKFAPWPNIFLKNPRTPLPPGGKLGTS